MTQKVVVVDYDIGNVFSVCNALKKIGAQPELTRSASAIRDAERLILPGVGAFARAGAALREYGLDEQLKRYTETGRPFLGICIGMQVLLDTSLEFGEHQGLGFIPGSVELIPETAEDGKKLRVPHIGWAQLSDLGSSTGSDHPASALFDGVNDQNYYYFVHSYHAKPASDNHVLATAGYGGNAITAAIQRDNIVGVQFHPERSGMAGLSMLRRFMQWSA